ncbi:MAG: hypothetical protein A3A32_01330 [Candidatus Wildermuthbacteria bacterium RIFCSPLOWO2_01_FULL_48_35]|uniref:Nudix hydrolase domain-containing protein n=2 Tax=Candidatus Wildermuthiibacteriota TaxID=1817923 RepID=A0A1G2RPZ1_9BACT|nr:MAG: hypothetical protein A3D59_03540 [Candidatus Wildermuthbacteria bacterium RIFCSPHIGHO2_02_FULL_47_17]OHA74538.1 MAG: hypothetical protein A3A32_01330 [Candidatus Wildermuthbacteria bacterium RIFCSPLOWO2_01_FULL_48_35]
MSPLRSVGEPEALFESRKFFVISQEMEFPDGRNETWEYVEQKGWGGVRICALTDKNELIFVREYRGAAGRHILRLPTGALEENENPLFAARRELEEEAGFWAVNAELICEQKSTAGYLRVRGIIYTCMLFGLQATSTNRDAGEQDMEVLLIPLNEAYRMVDDCEIENEGTVCAILWLKKYLRDECHS